MFAILLAAVSSAFLAQPKIAPDKPQQRIIDVHRHVPPVGSDDEAARRKALRSMDENGIALSVLYLNEPSDVRDWAAAAPKRFVASVAMPCWRNRDKSYYCFPKTDGWPDIRWLRREMARHRVQGLGEMLFNYSGIRPDDQRMWPYWALAAKYDVPVFVHTGLGPGPGQAREDQNCCVDYNPLLGNPALLRPILRKYPNLRIVLAHYGAGSPPEYPYFHDEALALMRDYKGVYVDLTVVSSVAPVDYYANELRGLIEAGFGDRILFGTDGMPPRPIIERLSAMTWMSTKQREDILYNNAARFLRLRSKERRS
jgi:uncharacterized protein